MTYQHTTKGQIKQATIRVIKLNLPSAPVARPT